MKRVTINRFIAGAANALSNALSPMMMPTYGVFLTLWVSVLCLLSYGTRVTVLLMCMGITCILPLIFLSVLHHFKLVKDFQVSQRKERLIPYLFTALCYAVAAYYLFYRHSPQWFVMFMVGSAVTVLVVAIINLKWKISAHMAGIGGIIALVYQIHVQGLSASVVAHLHPHHGGGLAGLCSADAPTSQPVASAGRCRRGFPVRVADHEVFRMICRHSHAKWWIAASPAVYGNRE